jgi:UPF0271 protein
MGSTSNTVNINADLGEGRADDAAIMPYLHACNIACGGHYGDSNSMRSTIKLALQNNVKVGAHPSFPDRENFGRMEMKISIDDLEKSIRSQINDFNVICKSLSTEMHHIKLHGALYNLAAKDETIAKMVIQVLEDFPGVTLYAPYNSMLARLADSKIPVQNEAFIDRSYEDDLSLVHRSRPNASINSPEKAWLQLQKMLRTETVLSVHGNSIQIKAETFCIHGDNENVCAILEYIQRKIENNDFQNQEISPTFRVFGDSAILISWPKEINQEINEKVRKADLLIQKVLKDQLIETVLAYQALAIYLKPGVDTQQVLNDLRELDLTSLEEQKIESCLWEIPICYSPKYGIDLDEMSIKLGLSPQEIVALHSSVLYSVYFIGFLPGFLYLGGLPSEIHIPRKSTPRLNVPAGAVGIGGGQTGIYPMESPGGWHLIGQSPLNLFDVEQIPPISIKAGDQIKFTPIDAEVYDKIALEVATGAYSPIKTVLL